MERLTKRQYGEIVSSKREKEPIQCGSFCNNCSQGTGNCHYVKEMVEKLAEYEDAEEDGLLIRLPVAEGSEVYVIDYVYECKYEFECPLPYNEYKCEEELPCENQYKRYRVRETKFNHMMLAKIGKTVFLSKEEAEQALAKMKGE